MYILRFYAVRRTVALLLVVVTTCVATFFAAWNPPADWALWPAAPRLAVSGLASGMHGGIKLLWTWMALGFLVGDRRAALAWGSRGAIGVAALWWGVPAALSIVTGLTSLPNSDGYGGRAIGVVTRIAIVPILIGVTPLLCLEAMERLKANPDWRRWFHDGKGPNAGFSGREKIRSVSRPMLKAPTPTGGHRVPGIILGKALAEDVGDNDCMIVHEGTEHLTSIGQPGSGKHIGAKSTYCTYPGSMIFVSNKSEQVDEILGARVDLSRMPPHTEGKAGRHGVNPGGTTKVIYSQHNGAAFLLDYGSQSVYPGNRHTLLSEVNVDDDHGRLLALAIADGWFPDLPSCSADPWFREAPRNALAATICHSLSTETDPRKRTLPYCIQRLLGIDPLDPASGPKSFPNLLKAMVTNSHPKVGPFVATTAAQIIGLGDRSLGSLRSTLQTNCAAALDAQFAKMLTGVSDFSYNDVGIDGYPASVFHVLPRGDASLRAALPIFRAHAELSLQILQTKLQRPSLATIFVADEARQYLQGVASVAKAPTLLRDARVLLWQMYQSWPSVVETLGQSGADELEACSVMQYFSINDQQTAEKVSRRLGQYTRRARRGGAGPHSTTIDVMTPEQVLRQLNLRSTLAILAGGSLPTMRVERLAFKNLVTREGTRFQGLPLEGQYDDRLSRYQYGENA